ncbi:MAG TPA: Mur ligase family protein [Candidatus Limnocylindria bacterium]|nr:Mur ligase family protein [Candidatus Limnocylindria bacterium]
MRLVEIRLLDGPNVYRLEPTVKVEVTVGRRRTWYGARQPERYNVIRLGARVGPARAPRPVAELAGWVRRLHRRALGRTVPVAIHRTSEPGHWIVAFPWREGERAETLARAALRLADGPHNGGVSFKRAVRRIREAESTPPEWITDEQRRVPIVSISGTNGKSTTTRLISHLLREAGRSVGTTTSDGVIIDGQLVEEGDLTGPMGAQRVLGDSKVDVAVLETARGGIVLRGVGYQSNEAAVLTNVSSDHLDLHGLHTLPELAEVKSVIARITRADGTVVLNADDPLVAEVRRQVKADVCYFSLRPTSRRVRAHLARGGRALLLEDGFVLEAQGARKKRLLPVAEVPSTLGGVALHNVANALAAAGAALALGVTREEVAAGLRSFHASAEHTPGRLNLHRSGRRLVIVDFAHNEAGVAVLFDMAEAILGLRGSRQGTLTAIVGTAGDRPDDTLRGIGRIAAQRADEVAIKETLRYLRGRSRASVIGEFRAGLRQGGLRRAALAVPVYEDEPSAVRAELTTAGRLAATDEGTPRVVLLMCHVDRLGVERVLTELGFAPVADVAELQELRR